MTSQQENLDVVEDREAHSSLVVVQSHMEEKLTDWPLIIDEPPQDESCELV